MKAKTFLLAAGVGICTLFFTTAVYAESVNLTVSPSVIKILVKPGLSPRIQFKLQNSGDPVLATFRVVPFKPADNLGHITLEKESKTPISVTLESSNGKVDGPVLLKSHAVESVFATLNVEKEAPEKDYYLTLVTETTPFPAPEGETSLQVAARIGANILVSVTNNGATEKKASISILKIPQNTIISLNTSFYDTFQKIPVVLVLKNDGRHNVTPHVTLTVKGWNMNKQLSVQSPTILSNAQRLITEDFSGLLIGRYSVTATVSNGGSTQSVSGATSFTAFPYKLLFGLAAISLLGFFFVQRAKK